MHVDVSDDAPTRRGASIIVDVGLTAVEGRQLTFAVQARDDAAVVSRGTHRRAVVITSRFQTRLQNRATRDAGTSS